MTVGIPTKTINQGEPLSVRARWIKEDGTTYIAADITSITQNVYDRNSATPHTPIDTRALTPVSAVITDTLVTTADWKQDGTGYNFDTIVAASTFVDGGGHYKVEWVIVGVSANDNATKVVEVLTRDTYS